MYIVWLSITRGSRYSYFLLNTLYHRYQNFSHYISFAYFMNDKILISLMLKPPSGKTKLVNDAKKPRFLREQKGLIAIF